jgi:hypothetical protein
MENKDLVWDLEFLRKRQRAKDLILRVENALCVYSDAVEQLYTNYDIFFPKDENRKLVFLPNPYAPHDTFHNMVEDAVIATGVFLINNESADETRNLKMVLPINRKKKKYQLVPIDVGLKLINNKRAANRPFLPVLRKGDLREFNQDTPCLHLHSLHLGRLKMQSKLELKAIEDVITERVQQLVS